MIVHDDSYSYKFLIENLDSIAYITIKNDCIEIQFTFWTKLAGIELSPLCLPNNEKTWKIMKREDRCAEIEHLTMNIKERTDSYEIGGYIFPPHVNVKLDAIFKTEYECKFLDENI